MHVIRFIDQDNVIRLGEPLEDGRARPLEGFWPALAPAGEPLRVRKRLAPVEPANIYCIGLNYRAHAEEGGQPLPENPVIFMKPTSAVIGPEDPIILPACQQPEGEVDYECELAAVIGKPARNVTESEALNYVFGYTCANDVSARHWQRHGGAGQWIRGKSFDTFCPLGPVIVTADELTDPQALAISTTINGRVLQQSTTADMIFPVARLISFISQDTTLLPGTVILTGTPQGVGFARNPQRWLRPDDLVEVTIENIGTLRNPVQPHE